jgi:excisionase family DNA binding protein
LIIGGGGEMVFNLKDEDIEIIKIALQSYVASRVIYKAESEENQLKIKRANKTLVKIIKDEKLLKQINESEDQFYTVLEAAEILRVSKKTVYKLTYQNKIKYIKLGRRKVIPRAFIDEMLGVSNENNA